MKRYIFIALVVFSLSFTAKGQNDMSLQNYFQEAQSEVEVFRKQTLTWDSEIEQQAGTLFSGAEVIHPDSLYLRQEAVLGEWFRGEAGQDAYSVWYAYCQSVKVDNEDRELVYKLFLGVYDILSTVSNGMSHTKIRIPAYVEYFLYKSGGSMDAYNIPKPNRIDETIDGLWQLVSLYDDNDGSPLRAKAEILKRVSGRIDSMKPLLTKEKYLLCLQKYMELYANPVTGCPLKSVGVLTVKMQHLKFIPEEFNNIEVGFSKTGITLCSPGYPNDDIPLNTLLINAPEKIVYTMQSGNTAVMIPICIADNISLRRLHKYHKDYLTFHVKVINEEKVYSGKVYDEENTGDRIPIPSIVREKMMKDRDRNDKEAQKYSDDELDEGTSYPSFMNLNVLDYVQMPFQPGHYEIWYTFRGLESNHCYFDIIESSINEK